MAHVRLTILVVGAGSVVQWVSDLAGREREVVVFEVPDVRAALETLGTAAVDVVVLDLALCAANDAGIIQRIRRHHPRIPVIVVSSQRGQRGQRDQRERRRGG